jgi:hypothetical protein
MKTVNLPETVYSDLVSVSNELAAMAGKPISMGMAVYLLTTVYRAHLREPCARDAFRQTLASSEIMSPEEFDRTWDEPAAKKPLPKKGKR